MNGCTFRDLEDMKTGDASTEDIFREFWGVENNEDHQYTGLDKLLAFRSHLLLFLAAWIAWRPDDVHFADKNRF